MRGVRPIMRTQMRRRLRDRRSLAWTLLFPVLLVSMFSIPFLHGGPISLTVGVVDLDESQTSKVMVAGMMLLTEDLDVVRESSIETALQSLRSGEVDAVIVIPSGLHAFLSDDENEQGENITHLVFDVYFRAGDSDQDGIITLLLDGMEAKINHEFMGMERGPILMQGHALEDAPWGMKQVIVPLCVSLVLLYGGIYYTSNTAAYLKESGGLKWLGCTPLPPVSLALGITAVDGTMTAISAFLAVITGIMLFSMSTGISSFAGVVLVILASSYCLSLIGYLVGGLANTQTASQALAAVTSATLAFFALASILPLSIPDVLIDVSKAFPLTHTAHSLRMLLLYGRGIGGIMLPLAGIAVWIAFLLGLVLLRYSPLINAKG